MLLMSDLFWLYIVVGTSPTSIVLRPNPPGNSVNFNFEMAKTLYQNYLKYIAFFFTFLKDLSCN